MKHNRIFTAIISLILILLMPITTIPVNGANYSKSQYEKDQEISNLRGLTELYKNDLYDKQKRYEIWNKTTAIPTESLSTLKSKLATAQNQYNKGSKGFFESINDEDNKRAVKIISDTTGSTQNNKTYILGNYTKDGAEITDSTNLKNMKRSIDYLIECNELRTANNQSTLYVNSTLMAISQKQLNCSRGLYNHSYAYNVGENLAWGYANPFEGWFYYEKYVAYNNIEDQTGHYENILFSHYNTTGSSYIKTGHVSGQVFSPTGSTYSTGRMTVSDYKAKFNSYYDKTMNAVYQAEVNVALKDGTRATKLAQIKKEYETAKTIYDNYNNQYQAVKTPTTIKAQTSTIPQVNTVLERKLTHKGKVKDYTTAKGIPNVKIKVEYQLSGLPVWNTLYTGTSTSAGNINKTKTVKTNFNAPKYTYYTNYSKLTGSEKATADKNIAAKKIYKDKASAVKAQNEYIASMKKQILNGSVKYRMTVKSYPKGYNSRSAVEYTTNNSNVKTFCLSRSGVYKKPTNKNVKYIINAKSNYVHKTTCSNIVNKLSMRYCQETSKTLTQLKKEGYKICNK